MKLFYVCVIVLLFNTGCSKLLEEDPRGQLVGTGALKSLEGLTNALPGLYGPLQTTWGTGFGSGGTSAVVMGGDDLTTHGGWNKQFFREMDQFNVTAPNDRMSPIWNGCYKSIQNANNIIVNYETASGDVEAIKRIGGEAHFIRALNYYWLVRLWGKIPLLTTPDVSLETLSIKSSTPQDVYQLIEEDLKKAEALLPDTKRQPGTPSRGSAKALLADVYLTEGGWPINDVSKYALAASKAKEVIDNSGTYGFKLLDNLEILFSGTPEPSRPEEVFALAFCSTCSWDRANTYYGLSSMPEDENGWSDFCSEINFYNNFPAGKRKDITFHTTFTVGNNTVPWGNGIIKKPFYAKFRVNNGAKVYETSMPFIFMRYAHVLLIYAEAQARGGSPDALAYQGINKIRQRAGLPDLNGLSQQDFIAAVINERAWEFAGESTTRWFDLQRLELVEAANANKHPDDLPPLKPITKASYWFPIPLKDASINPNLKD